MNKSKEKYREIKFIAGHDLESAVKELKAQKDLACGKFNGQMLYSDVDDMDSAYKKITGKTKSEYDVGLKAERDRYDKELLNHIESIPELTKEWIEKGQNILDEKYHETWKKCVPVRLNDLYRGMELGCTLEIVKKLNEGCDIDEAKTIIEAQGHSGMSFGLVCSMVKSFCYRGELFMKHVRP